MTRRAPIFDLTPYGRLLRARWTLQRALCIVLGHKLPKPMPVSRVSFFLGVALCACDRCGEGARVPAAVFFELTTRAAWKAGAR